MNFLVKLFTCQFNDEISLPKLTHKTVPEPLSTDEFLTQMWIRKTEDVHCEFDYKLGKLLGQGASGKVYLAEAYHHQDKKYVGNVALKVLSKSKMEQQKNYKKYLIIEKRIQSEVKSPFVIKFIESFQSKTNCYIACEYACGGELSSLLHYKRRKLMQYNFEPCVKFIAACVFLGLKSIHNSNFVYRDLKPQNILIVQNGYVKISDFGLSEQIIDGKMIHGLKAGTLPYFAPQMSLKMGHNKLIDLWSYGILIYELFTKTTPFTDMQINSKLFFDLASAAERNSRFAHRLIPEHAQDLITKLLKATKEQRIGANNLQDIKNHQFFKGFDWQSLQNQTMQSPLLPIINQHPSVFSRSNRCSSTDDEQSRRSCGNVSQFTTEGSPVKRKRI